jgi:hypothetical protein
MRSQTLSTILYSGDVRGMLFRLMAVSFIETSMAPKWVAFSLGHAVPEFSYPESVRRRSERGARS